MQSSVTLFCLPCLVVCIGPSFHQPVQCLFMQAAKNLGIALRGVSFHVGSGATNPHAFSDAIAAARSVFDRSASALAVLHAA